MLCKNCNYILTGKENYCPNCASPLSEKASQTSENQEEQQERDRKNEQVIKRELVFPEKEVKNNEPQRDIRIFYEPEEREEAPVKGKKKGYAGRILVLLFLICALTAGAFAVADYFNLTPSVFSFLTQGTADKQNDIAVGFSHESSIIKPDIMYIPERAYIMSGDGLSLRKGPGKNYAPVKMLNDLTAVSIYGGSLAAQGWVYVYCTEAESYGWLDGSFLAREEKEETTLFAENSVTQRDDSQEAMSTSS